MLQGLLQPGILGLTLLQRRLKLVAGLRMVVDEKEGKGLRSIASSAVSLLIMPVSRYVLIPWS